MVKGGCRIRNGVYYSSEHSSLLLLLSHPVGLSKTHGNRVTCLLKIRESLPLSSSHLLYRRALFNVVSVDSDSVGRAAIVPLATRGHGNVRLDSDEPAGAADDSDVPAAAMLQARSFGSAQQ